MQCVECNTWFQIMNVLDNKFMDAYDERSVYKIVTRDKQGFYFANKCLECKAKFAVNNKIDRLSYWCYFIKIVI